jgi:hypothetical protein
MPLTDHLKTTTAIITCKCGYDDHDDPDLPEISRQWWSPLEKNLGKNWMLAWEEGRYSMSLKVGKVVMPAEVKKGRMLSVSKLDYVKYWGRKHSKLRNLAMP